MSAPSTPSATSTPSIETARWHLTSADTNTLSRLQRLADDLRGAVVEAFPVSGPGFAGLALAARDGSGRTATLSFDDAVLARQERQPGGLARAARKALGLPAVPTERAPLDVASLALSIQEAEGCSPEEALAKAQKAADTAQGEESQKGLKVGDLYVSVTSDISSAVSDLEALDAKLQETAASMSKVAAGPITPSALADLIAASASALHSMTASRGAYDLVDSKLVDQVADDVAALVAQARALACPK